MGVRMAGAAGGAGPGGERRAELLERGWEWLQGRQEREEWTYVWRALLAAPDLAEGRRAELLERGWEWLEGRQEREQWTFVWQELLAATDLPEGRRAELLERG